MKQPNIHFKRYLSLCRFPRSFEAIKECPEVTSTEMHLITYLNSLNRTAVKKQSKLSINTKDISFRKADSDILKTILLLNVTFPTFNSKCFQTVSSDEANYNQLVWYSP